MIEPAVGRVTINDRKLEAHRVDTKTISDSILTEILTGISRSRLVLADITSIGRVDDRPVRNGNVLYEVGLAQAVRLPEEVLLFRSDNDPLLFDVSNIRVNSYYPDNEPEKAKEVIIDAILSAFKEIDSKKRLTVQRFAETLDYPSWWLLVVAYTQNGISHPAQKTMRQMLGSLSQSQSIRKLLEIGALRSEFQKVTPEALKESGNSDDSGLIVRYKSTELGAAIFEYASNEVGILQPEMVKYMEERLSTTKQNGTKSNLT